MHATILSICIFISSRESQRERARKREREGRRESAVAESQ